ncbi:MAG: type II toxin-antitoxin system RelE/ParE family toxin [Acidobacteriota bacterium]
MDYSIRWHDKAVADLKKLDKDHAKRIVEKIKNYLVKDPLSMGKPLKGMFKGMYRYRFGDYRILYVIDKQEKEISIMTLDHRKKVYKQE